MDSQKIDDLESVGGLMQVRKVTINGKALRDDETATLKMILEMATIDLQTLNPKRVLEGYEVSTHLRNVAEFMKLLSVQ